MRILILGATGMLGNAVLRVFSAAPQRHEIFATLRGSNLRMCPTGAVTVFADINMDNQDSLVRAFAEARPEAVINCIGLVKQLSEANNPLYAVPINTLLPHRLAALCAAVGARFIHISTDCVFSGTKGNYLESDFPDAYDLYGRSKLLGEVDYAHAVTLRTSIIGHETSGNRSLVDWFLSQNAPVRGFTRAIFSGLPTVELARVIRDVVLPRPELRGLYHVAAEPIDKYRLLKMIAEVYGKEIELLRDSEFVIDRSLNAARFKTATGYVAPPWSELITRMHAYFTDFPSNSYS